MPQLYTSFNSPHPFFAEWEQLTNSRRDFVHIKNDLALLSLKVMILQQTFCVLKSDLALIEQKLASLKKSALPDVCGDSSVLPPDVAENLPRVRNSDGSFPFDQDY